jgi:broad specificity phosphatase PhoE
MTSDLPKRSFYFLRHGQTDWNIAGRFQGHTDISLNEVGLAQARDAARILGQCPIDLIVASPLIRARKTAEIVSERLGKPLLFDDELKERRFGRFEGLVVNEVKQQFGLQPHQRLVKHLPPDAEQWHETGARTVRVLGKWLTNRPDQMLLFVTHSGLFDALHELTFGTRLEPKHAPYHWRHDGDAWSCDTCEAKGTRSP